MVKVELQSRFQLNHIKVAVFFLFLISLYLKNEYLSFVIAICGILFHLYFRPQIILRRCKVFNVYIFIILILTCLSIFLNILIFENYENYSLLVLIRAVIIISFLELLSASKKTWIRIILSISVLNSLISIFQVTNSEFYALFLEHTTYLNINMGVYPVLYRAVGFQSGTVSNSIISGLSAVILINYWKNNNLQLDIFKIIVLLLLFTTCFISGRTGLIIFFISFFSLLSILLKTRSILILLLSISLIYLYFDFSSDIAALNLYRVVDTQTLNEDAQVQSVIFRNSSSLFEILIGRNVNPQIQYSLSQFYYDGLLFQLIDIHGIFLAFLIIVYFFIAFFKKVHLSISDKIILLIVLLIVLFKGNYIYARQFLVYWFVLFNVFDKSESRIHL